jgi:hypothetical protein
VQDVAAPPLLHAGNFGELVDQARGDEQPPAGERAAVGQRDGQPPVGGPVDVLDLLVEDPSAVALDLGAPGPTRSAGVMPSRVR